MFYSVGRVWLDLGLAVTNGDYRLPLYVAYESESADLERFFVVADDWKHGLAGDKCAPS